MYKIHIIANNNFGDIMENFEGVYYRINKDNIDLVIIAGANNKDKDRHAFIQVIDRINLVSKYYRFDISGYIKEEKLFKIEDNTFSKKYIELNLDEYKGKVEFLDQKKLESSSVMGPFKNSKIMPCNHYVFFLKADVKGKVECEREVVDFTGAVAYMEGDIGKLFPKKYIWIQSNKESRGEEEKAITGAFAKIFGKIFFYLIVDIEGKIYRFSTYDFGKVEKLYKDGDKIHVLLKQKNIIVSMIVREGEEKYELKYPNKGIMTDFVEEMLGGIIEFKMYGDEKLIYNEKFINAAMEGKFT